MRPLLDDAAVVEDDQVVHGRDRTQPVRDDQRGPALHQLPQRLLHEGLALGVQRAGRLVEEQDGRVAQDRPGQCDPLTLPAREFDAAFPDHRVEARREVVGEFRDVGRVGGGADLGVGGVRPGEPDVLTQGAVEHGRFLRDVGDQAPQVGLPEPADVLTTDHDAAGLDVGHPQEQPGEGGLAAAGPSDEADACSARHVQLESLEDRVAPVVGEGDVFEADVRSPWGQWLGCRGVEHGGRGQEQFGELRGLGHRALETAVDLVELEHDAGRPGVVGEGDHDRLHAAATGADPHGEEQAQPVGEHGQGCHEGVDAEVAVVPRAQRQASRLRDPCPVFGRLALLGGEGAHRVHVHQRVGHMARHARDGLLAPVDQLLAASDERCGAHRGQRDHQQQAGHQQGVVAPQDDRAEQQGGQTSDDVEREGVDELLEAGGEAQHPLGE